MLFGVLHSGVKTARIEWILNEWTGQGVCKGVQRKCGLVALGPKIDVMVCETIEPTIGPPARGGKWPKGNRETRSQDVRCAMYIPFVSPLEAGTQTPPRWPQGSAWPSDLGLDFDLDSISLANSAESDR
jgi:hypothetical protein